MATNPVDVPIPRDKSCIVSCMSNTAYYQKVTIQWPSGGVQVVFEGTGEDVEAGRGGFKSRDGPFNLPFDFYPRDPTTGLQLRWKGSDDAGSRRESRDHSDRDSSARFLPPARRRSRGDGFYLKAFGRQKRCPRFDGQWRGFNKLSWIQVDEARSPRSQARVVGPRLSVLGTRRSQGRATTRPE